jgi:hypothetical protein
MTKNEDGKRRKLIRIENKWMGLLLVCVPLLHLLGSLLRCLWRNWNSILLNSLLGSLLMSLLSPPLRTYLRA